MDFSNRNLWTRSAALAFAAIAATGCAPKARDDRPAVVDSLIARLEAAPKANPPASIWRYRYKGALVYYVPPSCCDIPSELYDQAGNVICSPDGGLTGKGDGRCPDFFAARTDEVAVWKDPR